jgi:hypothetical protein
MPERVAEKRQAQRYPLAVDMELQNGRGITHDVSTSGIFVEADSPFSPGSRIRFSLLFEQTLPTPLRLDCEGKVIRVEPRNEKLGIAADFVACCVASSEEGND